ncbi:MAG: Cof-type HAD-IIB family hydrolase [Clostridiales bacterium]|nr:Cof-type HAD-IIB family hydrolase [Clostridiales bacterium]
MMSEIRLIALDLDGTLLDEEKRLSPRNEAALRKCAERGILLAPCTGRNWMGVPEFVRCLPGVDYAITVNGAVIEDVKHHQVLEETKLANRQALQLLELAKNSGAIMYDVYMGGRGYGEKRFLDNIEASGLPPFFQKLVLDTRKPVPDVTEEVRRQGIPVEKVNFMFRDMEERRRVKEMLVARGDVEVSASYEFNLEINAPGATKGEALVRLADRLGIQRCQTMGFGDGENDLTMMELAGIGVCMANGMETVKKKADYITATNQEDGVALAIEKLVLNRGQ